MNRKDGIGINPSRVGAPRQLIPSAVAAVVVDSSRRPTLELFPKTGSKALVPRLPAEDAYVGEIRYFINCVRRDAAADRVPPAEAVNAVRMAEAVMQSVRTGRKVRIS